MDKGRYIKTKDMLGMINNSICSICEGLIDINPFNGWAYGHNAEPVAEGRCCDNCNHDVLAARILNAAYRSGYKLTGKIREAE